MSANFAFNLGVEFLALNTDAQHLSTSLSPNRLQIGTELTSGLGCGANPDAGRLAAEESKEEIVSCIEDAHMVFITAGMGGGTGTGAAPVVAGLCYDLGILTVSVVTTPFRFEGTHRRRLALEGVEKLKDVSDTLIVVPNQNLFRLVGEKTSFVDSFRLADNVLLAGVRSITDLMTSPGLINLDFADVQSVMHGMGNALLGTGQACHDDRVGSYGIGDKKDGGSKAKSNEESNESKDEKTASGDQEECRAIRAAKMALNNPLLGDGNMDIGSAKGMLVNITGGSDMTLYEVDRAAEYITERVLDPDANIIFGSAYDADLTGCVRVSVVATGIEESNN
jgi:cell division protein FtsZ